jgi:hypothetical protein
MRVKQLLIPLLAAACAAAPAAEARAQPDPERPYPGRPDPEAVRRRHRRGSHFIAELNVGSGLDGGMAVGGLIGVGGKLKGFPPRFYLVAEFAHVARAAAGTLPDLPVTFDESWRFNDAALGLRIYVPLLRHVRLLIDAMAGCSQVSGELHRGGMSRLSTAGWHPLGQVATGLQVRPFYHLSLGARAKVAFSGGGTSAMGELSGSELLGPRVTLTGGLTWHW